MNEILKSDYFEKGKDGVKRILTPDDKKIDIVEFEDKKLCYVKSGMGYPAIYPIHKNYIMATKMKSLYILIRIHFWNNY